MDGLRAWLVALALGALVLTGCSSGGGDAEGPGGTGKSDESAAESEDLGDPFATRTINRKGGKTRLELYPIQADGAVATLEAKVTFETKPENTTDLLSGPTGSGHNPAGFMLVDTAKAMAYRPARDANDNAVCSPKVLSVYPDAGEEVVVSCTYAGLPKGVQKLDVTVTNFGNFPGVPVE